LIGDFKYRVALKTPTVSKSASAGTTKTFDTFATVWTAAEVKKSEYVDEGGKARNKVDIDFIIRKSSEVTAGLTISTRITYRGNDYQVLAFQEVDEDNSYIRIKATSAE
jgi:SPP1 family predicted phage head-tail adaptor